MARLHSGTNSAPVISWSPTPPSPRRQGRTCLLFLLSFLVCSFKLPFLLSYLPGALGFCSVIRAPWRPLLTGWNKEQLFQRELFVYYSLSKCHFPFPCVAHGKHDLSLRCETMDLSHSETFLSFSFHAHLTTSKANAAFKP